MKMYISAFIATKIFSLSALIIDIVEFVQPYKKIILKNYLLYFIL